MKKYDFIIFGNNVAAILSSLELSKNHKIALINPSKNWGGHFSGINLMNNNFDIGMNLLEFTTFHKQSSDLSNYNVTFRNDSARYFEKVKEKVREKNELVKVQNIMCAFDDIIAEDIIMLNSGDILSRLPEKIKEVILYEINDILSKPINKLHASRKKIDEKEFLNNSLYTVSLINHGKAFHDIFIEPFVHKFYGISSKELPALLHRSAWLPLYYPETILNFINKNKHPLDITEFEYPTSGNFSSIITNWVSDFNENITIYNSGDFTLEKNNVFNLEGNRITAKENIWSGDVINLSSKLGLDLKLDKSSITLLFAIVPTSKVKTNISVLNICDQNIPIVRYTNQNICANIQNFNTKIVIELSNELLSSNNLINDDSIIGYTNNYLLNNNILSDKLDANQTKIINFKDAITKPTFENLDMYNKAQSFVMSKLKNFNFIGPSSGFASSSFNDQVVQSLHLSNKYK